jgi:hypothetical protein
MKEESAIDAKARNYSASSLKLQANLMGSQQEGNLSESVREAHAEKNKHVGRGFSPDALRLNRISKASGLKPRPTCFLSSYLGGLCA